MMAEEEIMEAAAFLLEALEINLPQANLDPLQPTLLIECLKRLFPDSG
jgi:hypothetical protein